MDDHPETTSGLPDLGVPHSLLGHTRRRSFFADATVTVSGGLSPGRLIRETAHQAGAVHLLRSYGHVREIPRVSPIPGYTHLTHLADAYRLGESKLDPPLANERWEPSANWQVTLPVDGHADRTERAYITSVSLPVNHPSGGHHALLTWTTPRLAQDSSLMPTMLVSREAVGREWRIAFAAGTLFDDGFWLRDSVDGSENVLLHGAWDLHWSTDRGRTFRTLSDEQWQVLDCVPFGERAIFEADATGSELVISLWQYVPGEPRGKIERWTVGPHGLATPYLRTREEGELTTILRRVASSMTPERDDGGALRVAVRSTPPRRSLFSPSSWRRHPRAEPGLQVRAEAGWEDVPLSELLMTALTRAEAAPGPEPGTW